VRPLLQSKKKAINITYSDSAFVALSIQHALRMRHIVLCGLPGLTIFAHITSYTARFSKNVFRFSLQRLSEKFFILRTERDMNINVHISVFM